MAGAVGDPRGSDRRYHVRSLTPDERDLIADWHYPGRYATYDVDEGPPGPDDEIFAVVDAGDELIGYCCFGDEARIPGVDAVPGVVDVGYAMRPDLMGQGRGRDVLAAVLAFAVTGAVRGTDGDVVVFERPADG